MDSWMRSVVYAAAWAVWAYGGPRMVGAQNEIGGLDEQAADGGVDNGGVAASQTAQNCECIDSRTWVSPQGNGGCATYKVGGVNEGYCADDQAYTACSSACDSCPECSSSGVAVDSTMLWIGIPCIIFGLCGPVLKTALFYLKDDRKTVVQQAKKKKEGEEQPEQPPAAARPRGLTEVEHRLEDLERQRVEAAALDLAHEQDQEQHIQQLEQKVDAISPVQRSA